jgi:hypothetical protein
MAVHGPERLFMPQYRAFSGIAPKTAAVPLPKCWGSIYSVLAIGLMKDLATPNHHPQKPHC